MVENRFYILTIIIFYDKRYSMTYDDNDDDNDDDNE
jgi:hypothetical protein